MNLYHLQMAIIYMKWRLTGIVKSIEERHIIVLERGFPNNNSKSEQGIAYKKNEEDI